MPNHWVLVTLCRDPVAVARAEAVVQRRSQAIGLVQRFSLGFRGPLCLVAGFTGACSANPVMIAGIWRVFTDVHSVHEHLRVFMWSSTSSGIP